MRNSFSDWLTDCCLFRQLRNTPALRKKPELTLKHIRPPRKQQVLHVALPNPDELDERGATPHFNYKVSPSDDEIQTKCKQGDIYKE